MSLMLKICGLSTVEALDAALDGGADMVGFVFFPPSPRHLDLERARELGRRARGRAALVALSVDAGDAQLGALVEALRPDALQLHGQESPDRVAKVKARFGLPVLKALPVAQASDLARVPDYAAVADRLVFDARPPRGATRPGGHGQPFDWRLLAALDPSVPFMLSGGLSAANVGEALAVTRAGAVDVSSGVERTPGDKDPDEIRRFIRVARAAARAVSPLARSA